MLNTKPGLVAGYLARHLTVHHVICQTVRWRKNAFFRPSGNFSLVSTSGHDCPALLAQHASFKCLLLGKLVFFLNHEQKAMIFSFLVLVCLCIIQPIYILNLERSRL